MLCFARWRVHVNRLISVLVFVGFPGVIISFVGMEGCFWGHVYSVAARHESTTVGKVVKLLYGKGGHAYQYAFSVDGVRFDDNYGKCLTPLEPGACDNHGPVLVHFSFQPFHISGLEDFSAASTHSYRDGTIMLAIGLPLVMVTIIFAVITVRSRRRNSGTDC